MEYGLINHLLDCVEQDTELEGEARKQAFDFLDKFSYEKIITEAKILQGESGSDEITTNDIDRAVRRIHSRVVNE